MLLEMKFIHQDLTIIGKFNSSIIVPSWLKETGIYPGQIEIELNPDTNDLRYHLVKNDIYAQIIGDRFIVYPRDPSAENFDRLQLGFVSGIFNNLKYTPMTAIGFNFRSHLTEDHSDLFKDVFQKINDTKSNIQKGAKLTKSNFTRIFQLDDYKITLVYELEVGKKTEVVVNFELGLNKNPDKAISSFINKVKEFRSYAINYATKV
ncbi:hypothetical protein CH368_16880 [Leptospira levettii]|nr:hypothetical protein CH368_16880 [Leptospira levettii]